MVSSDELTDDELLGLVGNSDQPKRPARKSHKHDSSDDSDESPKKTKRKPAQKRKLNDKSKAKGRKKRQKKETESESESMSESESEAFSEDSDEESSSEEEPYDDGFGDDLMGDDADREALSKMTEIEREKILAERQNKREAQLEKQRIKEKFKAMKMETKKKKQPTHSRSKRDKAAKDKRSSRLKELKARRSTDKKESQKVESKRPEYSEESDSDSDYKQDIVEVSEPAKEKTKVEAVIPELTVEDLNNARVSRKNLIRWIHLPWFRDLVIGCFVRVAIGKHNGNQVYRVAEVTDVVEYQRVYKVDNTITKHSLQLKHGKSKRIFRMEFCSNSLFTEDEFKRWKLMFENGKEKLPSVESVKEKGKELKKKKDHNLTKEEVEIILKEKKKLDNKPRNFAYEKSHIIKELLIAQHENNQDEIDRLNEELEALSSYFKEFTSVRDKGLEALAALNKQNRMEQTKAELEYQQKKSKQNQKSIDDPFARRKFQPSPFSFQDMTPKEKEKKEREEREKERERERERERENEIKRNEEKINFDTNNPSSIHSIVDLDLDIDTTSSQFSNSFKRISGDKLIGGVGYEGLPISRIQALVKYKLQKGFF